VDSGRLGLNTACLPGRPITDAARLGRQLGFRAIELLAFAGYTHSMGELAGFYFDLLSSAERDELRRMVAPFDHVSLHAPFIDIALLAPNPGVRAEALRQVEVAIGATAFLGGSTVTAHACAKHGRTLEEYWDDMVTTFRALGDRAGEAGVTLTVETGHPTGVETFARLIHDIAHPAVGANIDVGHLVGYLPAELRGTEEGAARYRRLLIEQLDALGDKVFHFHLHDVRLSDFRDHRGVGRGFLDFGAIMEWCRNAKYGGLWVLELEEPDAVEAVRESKALLESLGRDSP
jgi:sugar phosphate isomerase/epimerase